MNKIENCKNLQLEDIEGEIWKPILDYEGFYEISNLGRVKSLERITKRKDGRIFKNKPRIMKLVHNLRGYLDVSLSNNGQKRFTIHRLIMTAFAGKSDLFVNHKDSNKKNNSLDNLEYVTQRENNVHYVRTIKENTSSKYIGVHFCNTSKKWKSTVYIDHKRIQLGCFENEEEASEAYQNALKGVFPEKRIISSSTKGVSYCKRRNKWKALKNKNKIKYFLGFFNTEEEAIGAVLKFKNESH